MFISEQVLYSKEELKQHNKSGDATGALAESGFRGHPQCRFCRKSFYGDNELFSHMQQNHEQCHLCRRARPEKYVYYRDYAELDGALGVSEEGTHHWVQVFFITAHQTDAYCITCMLSRDIA